MDLFAQLRKMNLLLIDDDEWVKNSLQLFFESEGCKIVVLKTAEEGLDLIEDRRFDIIIADYRLPGIDGLEFIRRLPFKQSGALKILITAYGSKDILSKIQAAGIHGFIAKPFTSEVIEATLKRLICQIKGMSEH